MNDLQLTQEEIEMVLSFRRAHAQKAIDDLATYEAVKRNCLADGMVEVEPGHFVRPGEPWIGDDGKSHH